MRGIHTVHTLTYHPYHGSEAPVLLLREGDIAHVSQVGHAASVGSVQSTVVLLDGFSHLLLAVLDLQ